MRLLSLVLALASGFLLSGQDTLLYENFQDQNLGRFTTLDNDNLLLDGIFTGLNGAFNIIAVGGPTDYRAVGVSLFAEPGEADNWLISPQLPIIVTGASLSWKAASLSGEADRLDTYQVMISTTGNAIEDFVMLSSYDNVASELMTYELDLSAYEGETIYLAFNQLGTDNYALSIDDIAVIAPSSSRAIELIAFEGNRYQDLAKVDLGLKVLNTGSEIITSFLAAGSINNNDGEFLFDNLSIQPGETMVVQFAPLFPFTAEKHSITASVTEINGEAYISNVIADDYYLVADPPVKKLVYEEATSTGCGWCIEGLVQKELMSFKYPGEVINISVHTDDPMQNILYDLGIQNKAGFLGFPSAVLNRNTFVTNDEVETYFNQEFSEVAPLSLDFDYDYNPESRSLNVIFNSTAHTTLDPEVHRYSLIILEDQVTGTTPDFAQANNYSFEASDLSLLGIDGVEWRTKTDPVPASEMVYNDVVRDIIGGFDGIEASIGMANNGDEVSYALDYILSSAFDDTQLWLVALVIDEVTGEIVNAQEKRLMFESGVEETSLITKARLYPNPAVNKTTIGVDALKSETVGIMLFDNLGQIIVTKQWRLRPGNNEFELLLDKLAAGYYQLSIMTDNELISRQLVVLSD